MSKATRAFTHLCTVLSILVATVGMGAASARAAGPVNVYAADARAAALALQRWYNPASGLFETTGWWQAANALNAVIDSTRATGSKAHLGDISTTFAKAASTYPPGRFLDDYYDDDGWWALTWVNAYDLTRDPRYLATAKTIFSQMTHGWDSTCGGGVWWNVSRNYKNAVSNELFLTLAARLNERTGDRSYLSWALREWAWFQHSGLINSSHLVNDGLDASTCRNNGQTTWTYNQGVIVGGLTDLFKITHQPSYLREAEAIADASVEHLTDANGILVEPCDPSPGDCDGDQTQFKGVFSRNLAYLNDIAHRPAYRTLIKRDADSVWAHDRDDADRLGSLWQGPFDSADASRQSSALDALNAAASTA